MQNHLKQDQFTVSERHGQLVILLNEEYLLPENAPVRLTSAQLEELDYGKLYRAYSPRGRKSKVDPLVRGKAGKPVEFGAKLDISVVDGWTRLECCSFDAYNEAGNLREMTERFRAREGHYPSRILADKIYRNRENLSYCKAHGIRLSGPALGRPKKGETRDKAQDYRDECERVEVERRFSLAKRKCGMGLVTAKLRETAAHVIAMSVLVLNLRKIQRALLRMLTYLLEILAQNKNWALVQ